MYLLAKFGGHRSYGNEDIIFYINSHINTLEKAEPIAQSYILREFQNQEHWFSTPKSRTWLAEKLEEEEYRQLQSVMRFTLTQEVFFLCIFLGNIHLNRKHSSYK